MQRFYHNDRQQLIQLLNVFNEVSAKYSRKEFDTDIALKVLLDKAATRYKESGHTDKESQARLLQAELATAERGIHPETRERVTTRRSDMKMGVQLKILQTLEHLLREELAAANGRLQEARDMLTQILLAAMQGGILNDAVLAKINTEADLQALWKMLAAENNIALVQKRILMMVSMYDGLLLMEELVTLMNQQRHAIPALLNGH
jgi:hypothetical protein